MPSGPRSPGARPRVVVLAGPNGGGKSSTARQVIPAALGIPAFVNADTIAAGLSGFAPENVAFQAGRILLRRIRELRSEHTSFAFETTLASRSFVPFLSECRREDYELHVLYISVADADLAVRRVAKRVAAGGHAVPEATVRRRFRTSRSNFLSLYRPLADHWAVLDNSEDQPSLVASGGVALPTEVSLPEIWRTFEHPVDGVREVVQPPLPRVDDLVARIEASAKAAIAEVLEEHRRMGRKIVILRDGRIQELTVEEALAGRARIAADSRA